MSGVRQSIRPKRLWFNMRNWPKSCDGAIDYNFQIVCLTIHSRPPSPDKRIYIVFGPNFNFNLSTVALRLLYPPWERHGRDRCHATVSLPPFPGQNSIDDANDWWFLFSGEWGNSWGVEFGNSNHATSRLPLWNAIELWGAKISKVLFILQ